MEVFKSALWIKICMILGTPYVQVQGCLHSLCAYKHAFTTCTPSCIWIWYQRNNPIFFEPGPVFGIKSAHGDSAIARYSWAQIRTCVLTIPINLIPISSIFLYQWGQVESGIQLTAVTGSRAAPGTHAPPSDGGQHYGQAPRLKSRNLINFEDSCSCISSAFCLISLPEGTEAFKPALWNEEEAQEMQPQQTLKACGWWAWTKSAAIVGKQRRGERILTGLLQVLALKKECKVAMVVMGK
jgi:hypothetical protein